MIDISDKKILEDYLLEKNVINKELDYKIDYCKGGVSCVAALVEYDDVTLLVKQGREKLAVKEDWRSDPKRMAVEAKANGFYHECIPSAAYEVLSYDPENCIMVRHAAPADCRMWKEDLLDGIFDFEIAKKTMEALAIVHNKSFNNEEVKKEYSDYSVFYELRISPYFEFLATKHPELADVINKIIPEIYDKHEVLVHADYSPKNILVNKDRSICILDYEIAHYGNPAFDIAFFTNHIVLKSAHMRKYNGALLNMLEVMVDTYFNIIDFKDRSELEAQCIPLLGVLMMARIDGKSPVEYIKSDITKDLVRDMATHLIRDNIKTYKEAIKLFKEMEDKIPE